MAMTLLFIGGLRGWQLILIIIVAFLLFGGPKKIPEIMRSLGKGVHSFKQGLEDAKEEINRPIEKHDSTQSTSGESTTDGEEKK